MTGCIRNLLLWAGAATMAVSAHLAFALWLIERGAEPLPAMAEAVEIELAPGAIMPPEGASDEAAAQPEPQIAGELPDQAPDFLPPPIEPLPPPDMAALAPAPPTPVPDFAPPPFTPLPPPDFASPGPVATRPPGPRPDRIIAMARRANAQPAPDPEPRKEKREPREHTATDSRHRATQVASPGTEPSANQRGERLQRATPASGGGGGIATRNAGASAASWQRSAGARVSAHMGQTRVSGMRGTLRAVVSVSVRPNGATSARLIQGTGDPRADSALARQAARMPSLPPPPNGQPFQFQQPISIHAR